MESLFGITQHMKLLLWEARLGKSNEDWAILLLGSAGHYVSPIRKIIETYTTI